MESTLRAGLYRLLPSVDELMRCQDVAALVVREGQPAVAIAAREGIADVRKEIASGNLDSSQVKLAVSGLSTAIARRLRDSLRFSLRPLINATGVILHTSLGRAPIAQAALEHVVNAAAGYS